MRFLLVEDNERLASLIRRELERLGYSVDRVGSLAEGEEACRLAEYDLIVLDRGLPDGEGLLLLKTIRALRQATPVLVLTAQDSPHHRIEGLDSGADDYLVKPFDMGELAARCRALLRRPSQTLDLALTAGNVALDPASRQVRVSGEAIDLRRREVALLEILMRRCGQVIARPALEQSLYSMDEAVSPNALDATVSRLRRRLNDAGAALQLRAVHGIGYILTVNDEGA